MSGDAFVVGDRLVVDQRAVREVGGRNDDAAWAFAVSSTGDVVRRSGGLKCRNGFDRYRRFWKKCEELRKLRLHLGDVATEIHQDLLRRSRDVLGIRLERGPE